MAAPPSPPPGLPPEAIQVIIGILVMLFTAGAALVKRLDRWLKNRFPPPGSTRPAQGPGEGRQGGANDAQRPAARQPERDEEPEDPQTVLMRELERTLLGVEPRRPARPQAPRGAAPEPAAPPPPANGPFVSRPTQPDTSRSMQPQMDRAAQPDSGRPAPADMVRPAVTQQPAMAAAPAPSEAQAPATPPRTMAATVGHRQFGHLALLHSPADLRNAVVLTEILGPPACYRRLGWRFPR